MGLVVVVRMGHVVVEKALEVVKRPMVVLWAARRHGLFWERRRKFSGQERRRRLATETKARVSGSGGWGG